MKRPLILRVEAEADIEAIDRELQAIRHGLGDQFLDRLRHYLNLVEAGPELFGIVWENVRAVRVRQFRYMLYYLATPNHVEVLAVMHGARHESEWQSRL